MNVNVTTHSQSKKGQASPARVSYEPKRFSPQVESRQNSFLGSYRSLSCPRPNQISDSVSRDLSQTEKHCVTQNILGLPSHVSCGSDGDSSLESTSDSSQVRHSNINHDEDSDTVKEIKAENERTKGQLRVLHQKLRHIEKGLLSIDEERSKLEGRCTELESEKQEIQTQLNLREKASASPQCG